MPINLLHEVKDRIDDLDGLLDGVTTIDQFCNRLERTSRQAFDDMDARNEYKGLVFELFVEYLINTQSTNPAIGIMEYKPFGNFQAPPNVDLEGDYGIDGIGKSTMDGSWAIVQVKYRSNGEQNLRYSDDNLPNGIAQAVLSGLFTDLNNLKNRILYVTTAAGIHQLMKFKAFSDKIRCIGRPELRHLCNQPLLWVDFKQSILDSQTPPVPQVPKILREHQVEAVEFFKEEMQTSNNVQIILPTGGGKTLIMSKVIAEYAKH